MANSQTSFVWRMWIRTWKSDVVLDGHGILLQLIPKTIGNRKGDCPWSCSRWQTQPDKICKSQRTNQCRSHCICTDLFFAICRLSQVVFVTFSTILDGSEGLWEGIATKKRHASKSSIKVSALLLLNKTKEQVGEIGGNWGDKQNRKWTWQNETNKTQAANVTSNNFTHNLL